MSCAGWCSTVIFNSLCFLFQNSQKLLLPLEDIQFVDEITYKSFRCIKIILKDQRETLVLRAEVCIYNYPGWYFLMLLNFWKNILSIIAGSWKYMSVTRYYLQNILSYIASCYNNIMSVTRYYFHIISVGCYDIIMSVARYLQNIMSNIVEWVWPGKNTYKVFYTNFLCCWCYF